MGKYLAPDGRERSLEVEHRLNEAFAHTFNDSAASEAVLNYLRAFATEACGPLVSDSELRHREGMRHLAGIIETRIRLGKAGQPAIEVKQRGPGKAPRKRRFSDADHDG